MTLHTYVYGFKYHLVKSTFLSIILRWICIWCFGWNFGQNLRMKIYPKSFRPK
jgi:hypothetical protein